MPTTKGTHRSTKTAEKPLVALQSARRNSQGKRYIGAVLIPRIQFLKDSLYGLHLAIEHRIAGNGWRSPLLDPQAVGAIIGRQAEELISTAEELSDLLDGIPNISHVGRGVISRDNPAIAGKTFVITGDFSLISRDLLCTAIAAGGGRIEKKITATTDWLIAGTNSGSRKVVAESSSVPVMDEEEAIRIILQREPQWVKKQEDPTEIAAMIKHANHTPSTRRHS